MKIIRNVLPLILIGFLASGCVRTFTLKVKPSPVPGATEKRDGEVAVRFYDKRQDKTILGIAKNGFGGTGARLVADGDLEGILTDCFSRVLEEAGYRIVPDSNVRLEGEIREFQVNGNGWGQGANEKIRIKLRNKQDQVLWEKTFSGKDGGIVWLPSSFEKSMNKALDMILQDALDEFTSDYFYQSVAKGKSN